MSSGDTEKDNVVMEVDDDVTSIQDETMSVVSDECTPELVQEQISKIPTRGLSHRCMMDHFEEIIKMIMAKSGTQNECVENLKTFIDGVLNENIVLIVARQALSFINDCLKTLNDENAKIVACYALEKVNSRAISFEDQVSVIRQSLGEIYEREKNYSMAAKTLCGITLDSTQKTTPPKFRLEMCLKITALFLEDFDTAQAEIYHNRASVLQNELDKDETLRAQYKANHAKLLHYRKKFQEAAHRYLELAFMNENNVVFFNENDRNFSLKRAVICTILSPAGQQRSRLLATLVKDERCHSFDCFPILEKLYMGQLIKKTSDVYLQFKKTLNAHKWPSMEEYNALLEKAILEHNLLAVSQLYNNISVSELGVLLETGAEQAESTAACMISEGRLVGHIDQLQQVIYFETRDPLIFWDTQIKSICSQLSQITEKIKATTSMNA